MQDRIQLKREEVVGEGVALSDINPVTNTKSVDDDSAGVSLDVTIERLWQAINNSLSRVVNTVNGRSGIVVITADDVGLGNVTNVSYGTIQEWVIKELADQFGIKHLMLFDSEQDMNSTMSDWLHDSGHANVPFYIKRNSNEDTRGYIGYFAWDDSTSTLVPVKKSIESIGYADNSIIYNESINDRMLGNGGIGVNIWSGEDALKIYNASAIKSQSGLMIDKDKIAPHLYFYNGAYGNDASEGDLDALVYTDDGVTTATTHKLRINIKGITMTNPTVNTCQTFKKNDIIVCNFDDNGYRNNDGSLKSNVVPELVCRETMIGAVISVPDNVDPDSPYVINFFPIKPYVGMGLKYYEVHTDLATNKKSAMIGIDLLTGKMTAEHIDVNISGINAFNAEDRNNVSISDPKTNHTVIPTGHLATTLTSSTSAFISPDYSLNVVPNNIFGNISSSPITNWPTKTPGNSTSGSTSLNNQTFFGINLLKKINANNAYNMSGLRIIDPEIENITNADIGKSNNDSEDNFATNAGTTSGGLMINVGKFLEIGVHVGDDAGQGYNKDHYYDGGKVNVRVEDTFFSDTDNRLGLKLSKYSKYDGTDPNVVNGGGLAYSEGVNNGDVTITPGLAINRGLGLRISRYNRFGTVPPRYTYTLLTIEPASFDSSQYYKIVDNEYVQGGVGEAWATDTWYDRTTNTYDDNGFLAASVIDPEFLDDFGGVQTDVIKSTYGGLRYMVGPNGDLNNASAIGLRVNNQKSLYGHELRLGSKAVGIDEDNVVGVQTYREDIDPSNDINPLNIKDWNEFSLFKYVKMPWMKDVTVETYADLPNSGVENIIYYVKAYDGGNNVHVSKRFIWTGSEYEPMFEYYGSDDQLPHPGNKNKAYVVLRYDNLNHKIWGELYQWEDVYQVHIPESWVPESGGVPGHYDDSYTGNGRVGVNASTATGILNYYSMSQTSHTRGYFYNDNFYSDSQHSTPITGVVGKYYEDLSTAFPHMFYIYDDSTSTFKPYANISGRPICREDIIPYDLDNNGHINAVDATIALTIYSDSSTPTGKAKWPDEYWAEGSTKTPKDFLEYYLTHYEGVKTRETADYVLMRKTADDGSYIPGLDIDINEYQGMTSKLNGDIKKSVSVKIFDKTAGYDINDGYAAPKLGGLRFTTEGYLSVRVNESNNYNATTISGRDGSDVSSNTIEVDHGGETETQSLRDNLGARGLMVYPTNVLGIQLTHDARNSSLNDNGELCLDEYGSLHISPNYHGGGGGGEHLTITDGTNTITYNGSEPQTITLGPGLILEPDPTPNP